MNLFRTLNVSQVQYIICADDEMFLSDGLLSGAMLVSGRIYYILFCSLCFLPFGGGSNSFFHLEHGGGRNPTASELECCFHDMLYMVNPTFILG